MAGLFAVVDGSFSFGSSGFIFLAPEGDVYGGMEEGAGRFG